jgi:hypothetical protein
MKLFFLRLGILGAIVCSSGLQAFGWDTADWMTETYSSRPYTRLVDVAIPGTHHSATYQISAFSEVEPGERFMFNFIRPLVSGWSKAQFRSVRQQLVKGIRYLDLRVAFDSKQNALITHGLVSMPLKNALNEISGFILEHPKEVILIKYDLSYGYLRGKLKREQEEEKKQEIQRILSDHFQERLISFSNNRTFSDFWERGASVMLLDQFDDFWPNKHDTEAVKAFLDESLRTQNLNRFRNVQLIFTPPEEVSTFIDLRYAFPLFDEQNSLSIYSLSLRQHAPDWIKNWRYSGVKLNIITTDFFDQFAFVQNVLDANYEN